MSKEDTDEELKTVTIDGVVYDLIPHHDEDDDEDSYTESTRKKALSESAIHRITEKFDLGLIDEIFA